ncbi:MAG: nucleotidyl transferase AbiEii/AbiGii toxin family protein [Sphingomonas taxi]
MAEGNRNQAASVKQRLLNLARSEGRVYDIVLVRYALERLLYRLSISRLRDQFILKGGMLVTLWVEGGQRETRDMDFLGFGEADTAQLRMAFAEIMAIDSDDALAFDTESLTATAIREEFDYGGIRLRTAAYLERSRIPVVVDIGFGDALASTASTITYPSLLEMDSPEIRAYPPATVIAEKFQAMVALGAINGRMKDYFDLWAIPKALSIDPEALDAAIKATFERRTTETPAGRPPGLSETFTSDESKQRQWRNYAQSIELGQLSLEEVVGDVWSLVEPSCTRIRQGTSASKNT